MLSRVEGTTTTTIPAKNIGFDRKSDTEHLKRLNDYYVSVEFKGVVTEQKRPEKNGEKMIYIRDRKTDRPVAFINRPNSVLHKTYLNWTKTCKPLQLPIHRLIFLFRNDRMKKQYCR